MKRIKKMALGMALAIGLFTGSAGSCYAASSSIVAEITASRAYGKFVYAEAGHEIKVTVYYKERDARGSITANTISDVQHGTVTEAVVSRNSPSGYQYTWGQAFGYVDGDTVASSGAVTVQ